MEKHTVHSPEVLLGQHRGQVDQVGHAEKARVAIVHMHFNYGGGEKMVSLLASNLDLEKCDIRVFCIYGDPHGNAMEQAILDHGVPITYIHKGLGFSLKHLLRLSRELSKFNPTVIHTHLGGGMYCAPWAALHGVRMLHTLHTVPDKEATGMRRKVMDAMFKSGKAIPVAISAINKKLTVEAYGLPPDRVEMVVNPVDIGRFTDGHPRRWSDRSIDFLHVGRFEEAKNHLGLLRAFARLVQKGMSAHLSLVGTGPLEDDCRRLVAELGLEESVSFLGVRDDVANLMHDAKCLVLPSLYEGLPMVILEAMAAGLPVLATAVGGVPDVVRDGETGMLIEPGDEDALFVAMRAILSDMAVLDVMSERARKEALSYDCKAVANEYRLLYEKYGTPR